LLVSREAPLASEQDGPGRWSVDHLFLDQDAIPTIVEVKRSSDTRIRREVVGQMLEYAANAVVYWPIEGLISQFETTCSARGQDPDEVLADFLGEVEEAATFWDRVRTNLQAGKVRLVFVADYIAPKLQRIVEFLNVQMSPAEVLAVQIKQYVGEGFKTLVPRVIGQTSQAQIGKSVGSREIRLWDEDSFFTVLGERGGNDNIAVARAILDWAKSTGLLIVWRKRSPGFLLEVENNRTTYPLIGVSVAPAYHKGGSLGFPAAFKDTDPFNNEPKRQELMDRLRYIPGVERYVHAPTDLPTFPLSLLHQEVVLNKVCEVLNWVVQEIRAGYTPS
jgi:hypothetical protein